MRDEGVMLWVPLLIVLIAFIVFMVKKRNYEETDQYWTQTLPLEKGVHKNHGKIQGKGHYKGLYNVECKKSKITRLV